MANLFVLSFKDEQDADNTLQKVMELQKQELIKVDDAAVAVHHQDGKLKVHQANKLVGAGALGGAFWGLLFGLIFFVPVAGIAVGAATGALMGKLSDYGIDDKFIKRVSNEVPPGSSALFLLIHDAQREKVISAIKPFGGKLIESSLSPEQESQLKEAFAS